MRFLKQSTSVDVPIGPFLDESDGRTAESALTLTQPDIRLKKNGAAWAQKNAAQTLSHEENGYYEVTLDATDTNTLGLLRLAVNESGALPVWEDFMVLPANVYDSLIGGSDTLDVQVTGMGANVLTASAINADAITAAKVAADVTTELQSGLATAAAVTDIKAVTDALGATAAGRLQVAVLTELTGTIDSTGFSPTTTQFEADDITEATADHFNGRIIIFTSGVLQYQATSISDYSLVSGRGHFTCPALTDAPGNNDTFIIV